MSESLEFSPGDERWEKLRKKGLSDLYFFASVILGYGTRVPMTEEAHRILCRIVERKTGNKLLDSATYRKVEMPRGTGKCGRLTDLVLTREAGYLRHDELAVGMHILSIDDQWIQSWQPIIALELQPATPIHQITMRSGRRLGVSGNHPIRMLAGWRRADEIQAADRVACVRHTPEPPDAPKHLEEATWLGYMVGDSSYSNMRFTNADLAILTDFDRVVHALGGSTKSIKSRTNASEISIRGLRSLLRGHSDLTVKSGTKCIPSAVFGWDNASLAAFLRALFSCDGMVERQHVSFSTISHRLARDVQRALLRFGIPSQVRVKRGRYNGKVHLSWRLNVTSGAYICRFADSVGFTGARGPRLTALVERQTFGNPNRDTVPAEWRTLLPVRLVGHRDGNGLRLTHGIRIDNAYATSWEKATKACAAYGVPDVAAMRETVFWDEVESVEVLPAEPVMAVQVAGTHIYCVEDVVTHNTTCITQAYLIQRICANRNISIMLANENEGTAKAILSEIKQQFEQNQLLRSLYPEVIPDSIKETTWSALAITVNRSESRKEPTVFVVGVGGTKTGMHPDVIFVDDMLSREAMESARAGSIADVMGQINRWIHQLVPLLSGAPDRELSFIGTRWYYGDSYEHLEESFGYGEQPQHVLLKTKLSSGLVQQLPAYRVGDLTVFRRAAIEDGQPAFVSLGEDKFGLEALAKMRMQDPELFAANMLNNPADELTATFKESWLRYYDWTEDTSGDQVSFTDGTGRRKTLGLGSLDVTAFVDPGGFGKKTGGDRARPATIVVGSTTDNLQLVLDYSSEKRATYLDAIKEFVAFAQRYGIRKAFVEIAGQQRAFYDQLVTACKKAGLHIIFEEVPTGNKNKDDRILGLEEPFSRGIIYIGKGGKFLEFRNQYSTFPKSTRKDLLDALSMMPTRVRKFGGGPRSAQQRQAAELAQYWAKRGMTPTA